jgi:hypothetical protein
MALLVASLWYAQKAALGWWLIVHWLDEVVVEPALKQDSTALGRNNT